MRTGSRSPLGVPSSKIAALRAQIERGTYVVDLDRLASRIVAAAHAAGAAWDGSNSTT